MRILGSLLSRRALLCGGSTCAAGLTLFSARPSLCDAAPKPAKVEPAPKEEPSLEKKCIAEAFGTAIIVQGGCGAVCALKYAGANYGTFGLAAIWGISVALAAYSTRAVSGAHLNPAVTAALVANDLHPMAEAPYYVAAQMLGATVAGAINYAIFASGIAAMEASASLVRGTAASTASFAGAFGMVRSWFSIPRPLGCPLTGCWLLASPPLTQRPTDRDSPHQVPNAALVSPLGAFVAEVWMSAILLFLIAAATDAAAESVAESAAPAAIGCSVAMLIGTFGPVTGCGMNPARDLGPRLVTLFTGWGGAALSSAWVYTLGPLVGGTAPRTAQPRTRSPHSFACLPE
jgi:glycerol uptake facilitator protein